MTIEINISLTITVALYWGIGSSVWNNTDDTATLKWPDGVKYRR